MLGNRRDHPSTGFFVSFISYDAVLYDGDTSEFYIDVTPEKRYAIWNKKMGRFLHRVGNAHTPIFQSKTDAEVWLTTEYGDAMRGFVVVEFDYPGEE